MAFVSYPTVEELRPLLGSKWLIARRTAKNVARYEGYRLITRIEYQKAQKSALEARSA